MWPCRAGGCSSWQWGVQLLAWASPVHTCPGSWLAPDSGHVQHTGSQLDVFGAGAGVQGRPHGMHLKATSITTMPLQKAAFTVCLQRAAIQHSQGNWLGPLHRAALMTCLEAFEGCCLPVLCHLCLDAFDGSLDYLSLSSMLWNVGSLPACCFVLCILQDVSGMSCSMTGCCCKESKLMQPTSSLKSWMSPCKAQ